MSEGKRAHIERANRVANDAEDSCMLKVRLRFRIPCTESTSKLTDLRMDYGLPWEGLGRISYDTPLLMLYSVCHKSIVKSE